MSETEKARASRTKLASWLALGAFAFIAIGAASYGAWREYSRDLVPPDRQLMRTHRLGKYSDQQLLELYKRAEAAFERNKVVAKEDVQRFWRERNERAQACESNPAEKLRRAGGCDEPLPIGYEDIGQPYPGETSPKEIFEGYILGGCIFADSIREARERDCLPR